MWTRMVVDTGPNCHGVTCQMGTWMRFQLNVTSAMPVYLQYRREGHGELESQGANAPAASEAEARTTGRSIAARDA